MKEVLDEKLDELIEEYGNCRANEATAKCLVQQGSFSAQKGIIIARTNGAKAKQAIIDYHDKKIREATKPIVEICERYKLLEDKFRKYNFTEMESKYYYDILDELVQAIKKTVGDNGKL